MILNSPALLNNKGIYGLLVLLKASLIIVLFIVDIIGFYLKCYNMNTLHTSISLVCQKLQNWNKNKHNGLTHFKSRYHNALGWTHLALEVYEVFDPGLKLKWNEFLRDKVNTILF